MRTPLKVSLVASSGVFLAALLAVLFHHNTINGRTLTPLEQLPAALAAATLFSALSLLGTWLGLRNARQVTYLAAMVGTGKARKMRTRHSNAFSNNRSNSIRSRCS